jgi:hypothetical protein
VIINYYPYQPPEMKIKEGDESSNGGIKKAPPKRGRKVDTTARARPEKRRDLDRGYFYVCPKGCGRFYENKRFVSLQQTLLWGELCFTLESPFSFPSISTP